MTVSTGSPHRPAKATPVSDNHAARSYKPAPQKTRMQFDWKKFQQRLKTLQFQRCYFKIRKGRGGIACEIGCGLRNVGSDRSMRVLRDGGAWPRCRWATSGPGRTTHRHPNRLEAAAKPAGQAAVPAGGGGAWPGFEPTRRAKLVARTARGRAAAHGRTKQPGPTHRHRHRKNPCTA